MRALLSGRYNVSFEDVRRVYLPAMRHRVILNFEAEAEGIEPDKVLLEILQKVPEKAEETKAEAGELGGWAAIVTMTQSRTHSDREFGPVHADIGDAGTSF